MISLPDYKKATNAAYHLIAEKDVFSLSTDVFAIAEQLDDCKVLTYGQACFLYGKALDFLLGVSEYGFSIVNGNKRIILYNEKMPLACIRFTLAHEIGHAVLGHSDEDDSSSEKEANCFARNLLCPIPVIKELNLESATDYVDVFNVSLTMANVAFKYHSSDEYYINDEYIRILNGKLVALDSGYESWCEFETDLLA